MQQTRKCDNWKPVTGGPLENWQIDEIQKTHSLSVLFTEFSFQVYHAQVFRYISKVNCQIHKVSLTQTMLLQYDNCFLNSSRNICFTFLVPFKYAKGLRNN
jgi:hypothetical protein